MKRIDVITVVLLFVLAGCGGNQQAADGFFTIDVTEKYPKKDFILQDIFDVEYIPLETNDEFICEAIPLAIGKEVIVTRNSTGTRDLFVFNRSDGKGLKKINRFGESGEEYLYSYNSFLDEENGELFVCDRKKILVYDLNGNFKRSFEQNKDASLQDLTNFDGESFIWWNSSFNFNENAVEMSSFFIVSKQDGRILREIEIPIEGRKSPIIIWREGNITYSMGPQNKAVIPYKDEMILTEASSDTVYRYTREHTLIPFLARTPSIQSMDPEIFLLPGVVSDRYCFMEVNTKQREAMDTSLALDRRTGEIFRSTVYNDDYSNKERVDMYSTGKNGNPDIAFCQKIDADVLVRAYEKDQLKGRLKEIAAELDEEDNAVIMLAKYKK